MSERRRWRLTVLCVDSDRWRLLFRYADGGVVWREPWAAEHWVADAWNWAACRLSGHSPCHPECCSRCYWCGKDLA